MSLLDQLRKSHPQIKDYSDEELLAAAHDVMGGDLQQVASFVGYQAPSSMAGKELYAGGNRYLAGMGHIGGALGIPGASDWAKQKEARAEALQAMSPAPHSWEEMKFGDSEKGFVPYLTQLAAGSAPYMAEAAGYTLADVATGGALTPAIAARYASQLGRVAPRFLGGQALEAGADWATRRAAITAAEEAAPGLARTAMLPAVTYPSSLGDVLGNQQEEAGRYDLPSAAAAAVPYSMLNVLGLEGGIARGALPRLGMKGLEKNFLGRAASGALASGVSEGVNETGQEVMNQYGRMGVNPNATLAAPEAVKRYKESFIGGALLGGLPGSLHAFNPERLNNRADPTNLLGRQEQGQQPALGQGTDAFDELDAQAQANAEAMQRLRTLGITPGDRPMSVTQQQLAEEEMAGVSPSDTGVPPSGTAAPAAPTSPLARAREVFTGNKSAWFRWRAKNGFDEATPAETVAAALLEKANDPKTANGEVWAKAHEDFAALYPRKETPNAVQVKGASSQVPPTGEAGQALPESGSGMGQGVQGTQVATTGNATQLAAQAPGNLSPDEQKVYDYLQAAIGSGEKDRVVDAQGKLKMQDIATALGFENRGSVAMAIKRLQKKIAGTFGRSVEEVRAGLQQRDAAQREVEASTQEKLGGSPAEQDTGISLEDLFGENANLGIVDSLGEAQGSLGTGKEKVALPDKVDPVHEQRKVEAATGRQQFIDSVLASPYAAEAMQDYDDMRSEGTPPAAELSIEDQVDYIADYARMKYGEITPEELDATQRRIEKGSARPSAQPLPSERGVPEVRGQPGGTLSAPAAAGQLGPGTEVTAPADRLETADERGQRTYAATQAVASGQGVKLPAWNQTSPAFQSAWTGLEEPGQNLAAAQTLLTQHNEGVRFSKANGEASNPTTVDRLASSLKRLFFTAERFNKKVTVVNTVEELPENVRQSVNADGFTQGFVLPNGKAYMIASRIEQGEELSVFLHEVGVHLGLPGLLGKKNFAALANQVSLWANSTADTLEARIARKAKARVDSVERNDGRLEDTEWAHEMIAYFVEEAKNAGVNPTALPKAGGPLYQWFRTLWAAVKVALRKFGLDRVESLTAQNIVDLAYGAAYLELEGTWHGTAAGFRRFNHEYMGSGEGAQAYGWGTYVAERPGIAHGYWEADVRRKHAPDTNYVDPQTLEKLKKFGAALKNDAEHISALLTKRFSNASSVGLGIKLGDLGLRWKFLYNMNYYEEFLQDVVYELAHMASEGITPDKVRMVVDDEIADKHTNRPKPVEGSLMRVSTAVADDEILDWDKPLSEQPRVLDAVKNGIPQSYQEQLVEETNKDLEDMTGEDLYRALSFLEMRHGEVVELLPAGKENGIYTNDKPNKAAAKEVASKVLDSIGIKGIKFADAQSRNENTQIVDKNGKVVQLFGKDPRASSSFVNGFSTLEEALAEAKAQAEKYPSMQRIADDLTAWTNAGYSLREPDVTRNRVIFDDKNIHRAVTYKGADREKVRFSKRADTAAIDKLPANLQAPAKSIWTTIKTAAEKGLLSLAITQDIADFAGKFMPSISKYVAVERQRQAMRLEAEQQVEKVLTLYDAVPQHERGTEAGSVNEFIHDSTIKGEWGYGQYATPAMKARFDKLSKESQALVKATFELGKKMLQAKKDAVTTAIKADFDDRIATEASPKKAARLEKQRDALLARYGRLMSLTDAKPYAPLKRYGQYITTAMSKDFLAAKAAGDTELLDKLKGQEQHYYVEFFDTQAEADARKAELDPLFGASNVKAHEREAEEANYGKHDLFLASTRLRKMLANEYGEASAAEAKNVKRLDAMMRDLELTLLAETSARQSEKQRLGVAGANKDMMRAIASQGRADAHYIASIAFNQKTLDAIEAMRKEAKDDPRQRVPYLNEMLMRHAAGMEYRPHRTEDLIRRGTSLWMLSTSPSFYLQQLTQTFVMSLPVMAGKHGYYRTARALVKAGQEIAPLVKGTDIKGHIDWSQAPADVRDMLVELTKRGQIDIGIEAEAGQWSAEGSGMGSKAWNKTDRLLRGLNTRVEAFNRASAAIVAYRAEIAKGKSKEEATAYAAEIVHQTHGSYDGFNNPRLLYANSVTRVLSQFRRFQIIQLSNLARLYLNATKGMNTEEKAAARAGLAYTLSHAFALGGLMGMPGMATLAWLATKLFGDPDDPEDYELKLRKALGNDTLADFLLRGTPASRGVDLSGKLGMGQVLSIAPFANLDLTSRSGYEKTAVAVSGPFAGGLMPKMADGVDMIHKGNYYKGLELLLPNGVANAMKGYRMANEGVTMRNGDVVLPAEEISAATAILQGLGLPTTTLTHRQAVQTNKYEADTHFADRTAQLKNAYTKAVKENDREARTKAQEDWAKLQSTRMSLGYKQEPLSTLLKAPMEQRKRERNVVGGVETTKANRGYVQSMQPNGYADGGEVIGQYGRGNIDLYSRPKVANGKEYSTVRSMSFNDGGGKEILVPTVSDDGRIMSNREAIDSYYRTGKHLGKFDTPEEATAYAERLHNEQAKFYGLVPQ